jgi:tRNA nucleotidyltransferase (CCA-adding enzyme)
MSAHSGFTPLPSHLVQMHPGLGVLRMAAVLAEDERAVNDESLDVTLDQAQAVALAEASPLEVWPELVRGLMSRAPSRMIVALRLSGALPVVLPEVAALFGVPQISDDQTGVDVGLHLLNTLAEAAACDAPLAVRFALLVMDVGKADSPPEHLPVHYRHIDRGAPRIRAICARFGVPDVCRELALLALVERERVHRVSEARAGPVAAMLERLGAFGNREQFESLLTVCACDYRAYGDRSGQEYPKAVLLAAALRACGEAVGNADAVEDVQMARASAIAAAFHSQRWS